MGNMARGVGSNHVGTLLQHTVKISNAFAVYFVVVYIGSKCRTGGEMWYLRLPRYILGLLHFFEIAEAAVFKFYTQVGHIKY